MPYEIVHEDDKVCVVKEGSEKVHCYEGDDAEEKAKKLLAALYANVDDATQKSMAVKMLTEDDAGAVVGGYLLLWGNPAAKDLQGDYFTPDTELMLDHYKSAPALFHHGLDDNVGLTVIGKRLEAKTDDVGVFVQNWIDKSNRYWKMVEPLLKAERLFYSPGSAPHLVKRAPDGKLLSFPVVEDTLTPTPAQYRLRPVEQIKAAYKAACLELPDLAEAADAGASGVEAVKARALLEELLIQLAEEK